MADFAPVFLICSERSGSNLIRVMLDAHPDVVAPPPLHFLRDVVGQMDATAIGGKSSTAWPLLRSRVSSAVARHYDKAFSRLVTEKVEDLGAPSAVALIGAVYGALAERSSARVLFVKENGLLRSIFAVMSAYPNAKFVFQVRDPRDYLASATKLREHWLGNKFGSTRQALELWREDQMTGLAALGQLGRERVFLQRYEDLIEDPRKVLTALCAFLGLPFDERMLNFHAEESTEKFASKGAQWKNLGKAVMSANKGNYHSGLSKRQIRAVEAYLGPLMQRFGYELDAGESRLRDVLWPMLVEPLERYFNGELAPFYSQSNRQYLGEVAAAADRLPPDYSAAPLAGDGGTHAIVRVLRSAQAHPHRPALTVGGETWTYSELLMAASAIAGRVDGLDGEQPVVGIFASRTWSAYAGVLAALQLGSAYVPLNPRFPDARIKTIIGRAAVTHIIVSESDKERLAHLVTASKGAAPRLVIVPDDKRRYSGSPLIVEPSRISAPDVPSERHAYILFTSGSTGEPKGVAISQVNLSAYLDEAIKALVPRPEDRFSQTFDLSFDLSAHDMFVCWSSGAHLVVAAPEDLRQPAAYIRDNNLTHWFSVPSLAYQARLQGALVAGAFPSLKSSLFCGEALALDLATVWQSAAPNGSTENWYGPTEATIACTRYVLKPGETTQNGIAPIGVPFDGTRAWVLRSDLSVASDDEAGELVLGGRQVAAGYIDDPLRTAASFVALPGEPDTCYRTGDLAVKRDGVLHFLGRVDTQVKIRGHRVELAETEGVLRQIAGGSQSIAFAWPPEEPSGKYILAAVEAQARDVAPMLKELRSGLPDYMVPSNIYFFDRFPTNASGKADRAAIAREIALRMQSRAPEAGEGARVADQLMAIIHEINPSLPSDRILGAASLIEAGMDSFGFVRLTMSLEERFGLELDQEKVANLSVLPFGDLVAWISSSRGQLAAATSTQRRANRAIQFVEKLPFVIQQEGAPLILAIGSSGIFRGFSVEVFDKLAALQDRPTRAINVGLPAVNCRGFAQICRYVRDLCRARGIRLPMVIYELDPMLVSTIPPKGDVSLDPGVMEGEIRSLPEGSLHAEFEWSQKNRGQVVFDLDSIQKHTRPRWSVARDGEIAETYAGRVRFDREAIADWAAGSKALSDVAEKLVCFVDPIAGYEELKQEPANSNLFLAMIKEAETSSGSRFMMPADFSIPEEHFMNINHVDAGEGTRAFTSQLYHWIHARPERRALG